MKGHSRWEGLKSHAQQRFEITHALLKPFSAAEHAHPVINKRGLENWAVLQISSRLCNSIFSLWLLGHKIHPWNSGFQSPFLLLLWLDCPQSPQEERSFNVPYNSWERKSVLCIFGIIGPWWFLLHLSTAVPAQRAVRPAPRPEHGELPSAAGLWVSPAGNLGWLGTSTQQRQF